MFRVAHLSERVARGKQNLNSSPVDALHYLFTFPNQHFCPHHPSPHSNQTMSEPASKPSRKRARPENGTSVEKAPILESGARSAQDCPYLATINRSSLDFDAEPICSASLGTRNVYACLVCGKYFQGRHHTSAAYLHAVDTAHHLFINVRSAEVYCLPDGYRVEDASFTDIVRALSPRLEVATLDERFRTLRNGRIVGAVALEHLGESDYIIVVLQLLLAASPIRNALINFNPQATDDLSTRSRLLSEIALLTRRIWAPTALRSHHTPHAIIRLISEVSKQRFTADKQGDPVMFLAWILNTFASRGKSPAKSIGNVLRTTFQGRMKVVTISDPSAMTEVSSNGSEQSFWFLTLNLPPRPLFKDEHEGVLVPQIPLEELLSKYNGEKRHFIVKTGEERTYALLQDSLPPYLLLTLSRFERSKFGKEKNPAVVQSPLEGLLVNGSVRYNLVGAIVHDGGCDDGKYRVVLFHKASGLWYNISESGVEKTMAQLATLKETYILMYERQNKQ